MIPTLCIVMPCYNEEVAIDGTIQAVSEKLDSLSSKGVISPKSCMLFVDDGSSDSTWNVIEEAAKENKKVKAVKFAANRGKEKAIMAGLMVSRDFTDLAVCMDADLQHDINALDQFLEWNAQGYDLVYGVRRSRGRESLFKKTFASLFYKIMDFLGTPVLKNHTDYSLMTRQVLDALSEYGEYNFMFRGTLKSLGFRQIACPFDVLERESGNSKFTPIKLFNLAFDSITSFSIMPLRFIGIIGFLIFVISIIMIVWIFCDYFRGVSVAGWASLSVSLWFLGGVILLSIAVVGEYLGKTYMEVKRRPRYYIEKKIL